MKFATRPAPHKPRTVMPPVVPLTASACGRANGWSSSFEELAQDKGKVLTRCTISFAGAQIAAAAAVGTGREARRLAYTLTRRRVQRALREARVS